MENNFISTSIIDSHSHFLPNMDDGSSSIDESIEMLEETKRQNINYIVSTSHFYPNNESPEDFIKRRDESLNKLMSSINTKDIPKIYIGAEVYFYIGICGSKRVTECTIRGTKYLLLEMPFAKWDKIEVNEVITLMENFGVIPIIAHINRYFDYGNLKHIKRLQKEGCILQLNSEYFIDKKSEKKAIKLVKKGLVDLIGSDMHNTKRRPQTLGKTISIIEKKCGHEYIQRLEYNTNIIYKDAISIN
ncbi:hypothetical protein J6Y73_00825 [bacterium]|nr:hypothetical protein [bacterium]